jgi:hypothetical protein
MPRDIQVKLKEMRTLVQEMGWEDFMAHVVGLMAEQSDKSAEPQSTALFRASNLVASLRDVWKECGKFDYASMEKIFKESLINEHEP